MVGPFDNLRFLLKMSKALDKFILSAVKKRAD